MTEQRDVDARATERERCAVELDRIAADVRFAGREHELRDLAAAVRDQSNGHWTGVDLVGAFPAEASITVPHVHMAERLFGLLAGASVFLPVAWTWLGIHSASKAYKDLLAAGDENGRTFLAMWTTGFDGRMSEGFVRWHQFVPMAMVSFALVVLAVFFIVGHRMVAEMNVQREETQSREARRDLVLALGTAQRLLNERRLDDPAYIENAIKRSVDELNRTHEKARQSTEALQEATKQAVDSLNAAAKQAVTDLGGAAQQAASELGGAARQTATELGGAAQTVLAQLQPFVEATTSAGTELSSSASAAVAAQQQITTSTARLEQVFGDSLAQFTGAVESSSSALTDGAKQHIEALTAQLRSTSVELSAGVANATRTQDEIREALVAGLHDNQSAVGQVDDNARRFVELLEEHHSTIQAQASDLARAADLAAQVLAELRGRQAPFGHLSEQNGL